MRKKVKSRRRGESCPITKKVTAPPVLDDDMAGGGPPRLDAVSGCQRIRNRAAHSGHSMHQQPQETCTRRDAIQHQ